MLLSEILAALDGLAPLRYAEAWDNVGLLVGDPDSEIARVLVTVDYSAEVAAEAHRRGANLVVAYHPPMFAAVKRVPHDALWAGAIRAGIALYSMHTALDVARDGTNDFLARACGVAATKPLRPFAKPIPGDADGIGLGRIGDVPPMSLRDLVARLKRELDLPTVMVAGDVRQSVTRIAVAAGAGGELLSDAIKLKADVFVTGELRHHDALRGCAIVATLHSNSERKAVMQFADRLRVTLGERSNVEVLASEADRDPFYFV